MGKIIAIGGGEIGRKKEDGTFYPVETTEIDKEIIRISNSKKPNLLFIPTASNDSQRYCQNIFDHFETKLGCKVNFLKLVNTELFTCKHHPSVVYRRTLFYFH